MTIQRAKDLLSKSFVDPNELRNAIIALQNEKKYVESCIVVGFRDREEGRKVIDEISFLLEQLKQRQ